MNTFMPYSCFVKSAKCLDRQRLGKQRVEVMQILDAIANGSRWQNHPAVTMWRNHELSLCSYGETICREWRKRGYKDTCAPRISAFRDVFRGAYGTPWWLGSEIFHAAHRAALLAKAPEWYQQFGWSEPPKIAYFWPKPSGIMVRR